MVGRKVGRSESGSGMLTVLVSTFRPSQRSERQKKVGGEYSNPGWVTRVSSTEGRRCLAHLSD